MDKKVRLNSIMQLFILFTNKKWIQIDSYEEVLRRFGNLMESLSLEQTNLLLELIERYTWLSYNEYHAILRKLFIQLHKNKLKNVTRLYVFPIKKLKDEDKVKSGDIVQYMVQGILAFIEDYKEIDIVHLKKFDDLSNENLELEENEYIVFLDDYIGSGKTLEDTLEQVFLNTSINSNYSILSTLIQEETVLKLEKIGIEVFYGMSTKKGISNYYKDEELDDKIRIMNEIEEKIPGVKDYKFGFEKSEGLATLIRTPNNTFPIFWKEYLNKREKTKAPFARY